MATTEMPKIDVQSRERLGSRYASRLRTTGRLPAVIYGHQKDPLHVSVDGKAIVELLHRNVHVIEVTSPSGSEHCLVKDIQWDHLGSTIIHVDLARVDLSETVTIDVQVEYVGEAIGLKEAGAILEHPFDTIEIECRVDRIPEMIKIDVSGLNVDDTITVANLALEEGIRCTMTPGTILATVRIVEEEVIAPVVAAEGEAAEPEVIGRVKAEGEEGEEAAPAAKKEEKKEKK